MTSFCVFGISRPQCKKSAEQRIGSCGANLKAHPLMDGRAEKIAAKTQELFDKKNAKPKQISPAFDAPQFADGWIAIELKTGQIRAAKIMTRGTKNDKYGAKRINKKGEPTISWIPYEYPHPPFVGASVRAAVNKG